MQTISVRSKELWSGVLFVAIGVAVVGMALEYPIGTPSRMGPGFFPLVLGCILTLLGLVFLVRAGIRPGNSLSGWNPIALVCVLGSVALFAALLEPFGLAIAAFLSVALACAAGHEYRWGEVLALGIGLALFVVVLFAMLLKLQVGIGPSLWS
jgi:hypothetical protein